MYFGCRNRSVDFIYEKELLEYQANGTLSQLHLAFSRDTDKKVYVQDLLAQNKEEVGGLASCGQIFFGH